MEMLRQEIHEMRGDIADIRNDISDIKDTIFKNQLDIARANTETAKHLAVTTEILNGMVKNMDKVSSKVEHNSASIVTLKTDIASMKAKAVGLATGTTFVSGALAWVFGLLKN